MGYSYFHLEYICFFNKSCNVIDDKFRYIGFYDDDNSILDFSMKSGGLYRTWMIQLNSLFIGKFSIDY
jgi:hypothetical protein